MIARIWHGYVKPEDADAYEVKLKPELLPGISKVPGYRGAMLLRRQVGDEVEFITITFWDSIEAIKSMGGKNYEASILREDRLKYLTRYDTQSAHYEIRSLQGVAKLAE